MKHSELKESFKLPYMHKIAERLSILKMTNKERETYDTYLMDSMKGRDYLISAEEKGKAEENIRVKIEIAKAMLLDGDSVEKIAKVTGVAITEVEKHRFFDIKGK